MSTVDRRLKAVTVKYIKNGKFNVVQLIECDRIDIKFYDEDNKLVHIETGEIIKIGEENEMPYLILVPYNIYLDKSIYNVPIDKIYDIINVNRGPVYSLSPVYSSDESVAALRRDGDSLQFTTNGKDWITCDGGGGSDITIDDVDREIDKKWTEEYNEVVNNKIEQATEGLASTEYVNETVESATEGLASTEYVDNKIATDLSEYDKSAVVDEKIETATDPLATRSYVDDEISSATEDLAPKNNPTFTGTVSIPTPAPESDDTTAASTAYVTDKIDALKQELAGALHFKGVVDTYEDLINIENPEEGDVWQVRTSPAGENAEYAWAGALNNWIELGTVIDLSAYETKAEATAAINAAIETANQYTDEKFSESDIYALAVEKGYVGTKAEFCEALADLCNHVSVVPIVKDHNI